MVAYLGSVENLKLKTAVLLCVLFSFFSFSNNQALSKNLDLRISAVQLVTENASSCTTENLKEEIDVKTIIVCNLGITHDMKVWNMRFQVLMSGFILLIILSYTSIFSRLTNRSKPQGPAS